MTNVLLIDDERLIRDLTAEMLVDAGYHVESADTAERGLELLAQWEPDIVVSDVLMPGLSGLELLEAVRNRRASLPVVLVTAAGTYDILTEALAQGAAGLVTKPFTAGQLTRAIEDAIDRARRSENELRERLLAPTLASALANAIEARNSELHGHCERLAAFAVAIAERLGLDGSEIEAVRLGAILHDVGKIGIPDSVLLKPGPLTTEERVIINTHTLIGDNLLAPLDLLAKARPVVRHHHERWDGGGYPDGLSGTEIPLGARIVAVADAIEAMSSKRVYHEPYSPDKIEAELHAGRGAAWDPQIVDFALQLFDREGVLA
ncbi:MAG TPA: HD domain-containing phosphohydrolase [Kofleriaceae bacterium]|jgi:putative two-component system response regulator